MYDFNNIINIKGHKNYVNSIDTQENGGFSVVEGEINIVIFDLITRIKIGKFVKKLNCFIKVNIYWLFLIRIFIFLIYLKVLLIKKIILFKKKIFVKKLLIY